MFFYNESDSEVSQVQPTVSDPYFYNTSLLLKMDSDFSDSSVHQHTVTVNGNVAVSNSEFKYDGGSGYFDGNTNTGVSVPASEQFNLSGVDWTIETWIRPDGNYSTYNEMFHNGIYGASVDWDFWLAPTTGQITFYSSSGQISTGVAPQVNQWNHLAAVRYGGTVTVYLNGSSIGSAIIDLPYNNNPLGIGNVGSLNKYPFVGHIDDVRITKGVARYTANFTPPDSHPTTGPSEIVSTDLQLHLDAGDTNSYPGTGTTWYDLSGNGNDGSFVGTPSFDSATNSIYFDSGPNTYVQTPYNSLVSNISLSVWFKAPVQDNNPNSWLRPILCLGDIGVTPGPLIIQIFSPNSPYDGQLLDSISTRYDDNQWHNAVITLDGTQQRYYVDGALYNETTINSYDVSIPLRIGAGSADTARRFLGRVSEVLVYEKSLSDAEVLQNFEVTKSRFGL